jgi:preprotein translocase subunit SecD
MKKSAIAVFIIAFLLTLMFLTTPLLLHSTQVGLEFRGGYEVLYAANSEAPEKSSDKSILLKTAAIIRNRAVELGVAEPSILIEHNNLIRVKLASVFGNNPVRAILNQPEVLPVRLIEKYSQTISGVLGRTDFYATLMAGLFAVYGIFLFIGIIYQGPGLVAVLALMIYLWLLLVVFNLLHTTLSLATAVAFVLGIGIASNANILSFERIKEELGSGKANLLALREGHHQAFRAILDSNVMVLIGSLALFAVDISPIRGFAITTILSILISSVCNVFLVRLLLKLLVQAISSKVLCFLV